MKAKLSVLITGLLSLLLLTVCSGQNFTQEQKIRMLQAEECLENQDKISLNYQNLLMVAYRDASVLTDSLDKYKADFQGVSKQLKEEEEENSWLVKILIFSLICTATGIYFSLKFYKKIP